MIRWLWAHDLYYFVNKYLLSSQFRRSQYEAQIIHSSYLPSPTTLKGVYTWIDEQGKRHNKDGHAATVECATGEELVIPPARFADPVNMNPEAYDWIEIASGVRHKELGSFTEAETRVSFLRLEDGASYEVSPTEQATLLFGRSGTGDVDGQTISERDGIMLDPSDPGVTFTATGALDLFVLALPKLSDPRKVVQ